MPSASLTVSSRHQKCAVLDLEMLHWNQEGKNVMGDGVDVDVYVIQQIHVLQCWKDGNDLQFSIILEC